MATTTMAKPIFGPVVTEALFETRWSKRFLAFDKQCPKQPEIREHEYSTHKIFLEWLIEKNQKVFPLLLYCQKEARTLGYDLQATDEFKTRLQEGGMCENVLETAILHLGLANMAMSEWMEVKMGRRFMFDIFKWQKFSYDNRQKMNGLLTRWTRAIQAGEWECDETVKAVILENAKKYAAELQASG